MTREPLARPGLRRSPRAPPRRAGSPSREGTPGSWAACGLRGCKLSRADFAWVAVGGLQHREPPFWSRAGIRSAACSGAIVASTRPRSCPSGCSGVRADARCRALEERPRVEVLPTALMISPSSVRAALGRIGIWAGFMTGPAAVGAGPEHCRRHVRNRRWMLSQSTMACAGISLASRAAAAAENGPAVGSTPMTSKVPHERESRSRSHG